MAENIGYVAATTLFNWGAWTLLDGTAISSLNLPHYILGCAVILQIAPSQISLTLRSVLPFFSKIKVF